MKELNNKAIIFSLVTLIIGLGIGYGVGVGRGVSSTTSDMHMMSNNGNTSSTMSMSDMMNSMNADLQGKTGDAFDQVFLSEMIIHHQGAVQMAQQALTNAKHQEIKDLAKDIISAQNKEIGEMQQWQRDWYNK